MEQRESLDRSSTEILPITVPGTNGLPPAGLPAGNDLPPTTPDSSPVVESVLKSDVSFVELSQTWSSC